MNELFFIEKLIYFVFGFILGSIFGYSICKRYIRLINIRQEKLLNIARIIIGIVVTGIWVYSMFLETTTIGNEQPYITSPFLYGVFGVVLSTLFSKEATEILDNLIRRKNEKNQ